MASDFRAPDWNNRIQMSGPDTVYNSCTAHPLDVSIEVYTVYAQSPTMQDSELSIAVPHHRGPTCRPKQDQGRVSQEYVIRLPAA